MEAGDLIWAIGPPARCGTQRLEQAAALIQAQRLDADAEAAPDLGGTELHDKLILSTCGTVGADPGDGASPARLAAPVLAIIYSDLSAD
jgi:hypothetical protein